MHNIKHKRKAVSPVIATVILIAVAVALGIAVAFWASGLTSSFSKYEKLGVNTQYAIQNTGTSATPGWIVNLGGQNTGSSDSTITQIQINGVPYPISNSGTTPTVQQNPCSDWKNTYGCVYWSSTSQSATANLATLSVRSGDSFSVQLFLDSSSPSSVMGNGKSFASGQTIQVTIITAAGNNYPASIVLP